MELNLKGDKLTITVDLKNVVGPSSTGKSTIVDTTNGFLAVPGTSIKVSLNVIKPLVAGKLRRVS